MSITTKSLVLLLGLMVSVQTLNGQDCTNDTQPPVLEGCADVNAELMPGQCGNIFTLPFTGMSDDCPATPASFSQSTDNSSVEEGYSCPGGTVSYWRVYSGNALNTGLEVSDVTIRVFESNNNPEVTVNIYALDGNITSGTLTELGTGSMDIGNLSNQLAIIPVVATVPAMTNYAVEVVVPGTQFNGPIMGLNNAGETGPTYVTSSFCNVNIPTTLADLGFAGFGAVIDVNGMLPSTALVQIDDSGFAPGDTLPSGSYDFEFNLVDASGNTDNCTFTYTVAEFSGAITAIACNDEVQISLDEDCIAVVTADQILEGGPYGCFDDYIVEIFDEDNVNYGNTLTTDNVGQTLQVQVTGPNLNACWGHIILEDKAPAPLECEPVYTSCSGELTPGSPVTPVVTFDADLNPITESLPAVGTVVRNINIPVFGLADATVTNVAVRFDISHESVSDLTATVTSPEGISKVLFLQPGTTCSEDNLMIMINPQASNTATMLADSCAVGEDFAVTGSYQPTDDFSDFNGTDPNGEWTVSVGDINDGNGGTINSIQLVLTQAGAEISFPTTKDITYIQTSDDSYRVEGLDACGPVDIAYTDLYVDQDCDSEFDKVILRTWAATDENGNESETCVQEIYVYRSGLESIQFPPNYDDLDQPSLSCALYGNNVPGTDITGSISGELCDIVQVFNPEDVILPICDGSYKVLRKFKVLQWCSGEVLEHTQIIKVLDKEGPVLDGVDDITISAGEFECGTDYPLPKPEVVSDCSDEFTYSLAYLPAYNSGSAPTDEVYFSDNVTETFSGDFVLTDITFGNTWVRWTVEDECGNITVEYFTLTVEDQVAPIAVCDEFTVVSVGGDGTIKVNAESFDDGSFDNCGVQGFAARKMTDICFNGSTTFRDYVEFCCDEVGGDPVMVEFQVTDNFGNSNTCMVEVVVQDKLPPYITQCPDDITLDCQADYEDLSVTGEADGIDNCEVASINYSDSGSIDNCGQGTITRTWTITDIAGLKGTCVQTIVLENDNPFDENDIDWPNDYDANTCDESLDPDNLPEVNAYPRYEDDICSLVATTYKDQTFSYVDGACEKILRKWTVIDWCTYDEFLPIEEREGLYEYVQVIKLTNSEGPEISNCNNRTIEVFGDCEGDVDFTLIATDDCTDAEEIEYEYTIDIDNDGIPDPNFDGNTNRINRVLTMGTHLVRWKVADKCGNVTNCMMELRIVDGKKPTPYCRGNVVTAVMNSDGMIDIWASDYDLGSYDNCTPQDELRFSFSLDPTDDRRVFSCADIPDGDQAIIPLKMYVTDLAGNSDYCDITIQIQDNEANFCDPEDGDNITIGGTIETFNAKSVPNTQVTISTNGEPVKQVYTDSDGKYKATGLQADRDYDVSAYNNDNLRNGVNTLDLVKIQRHILGLEPFANPYLYLAGDINNDERIKANDLLSLRKVILGISNDFPNEQTSWRFVDADYEFIDQNDPFPFVESIFMDNLGYSANYENMVAVKVGDLDNTVQFATEGKQTESRSDRSLTLLIDEQEVSNGSTISIPVYAQADDLAAYQFTMKTEGLTFVEVISGQLDMDNSNFGIFDEAITTSWNTVESKTVYTNEPLFTLVFDVTQDMHITEALSINSDITAAAAFDIYENEMDVEIAVRADDENYDEFTVFQNRPNPFTASTKISFFLPAPADVRLNIYDVSGRMILTKSEYFENGLQEFNIENDNLDVGGVLYYEVSAGDHKTVMKMISIK